MGDRGQKRKIGSKYNPYKAMTDKFIEMIEKGTSPWQRPWTVSPGLTGPPVNAVTNRPYRGMNALNLAFFNQMSGDNRFATEKQIKLKGWTLREGAIRYPVYFFKEIGGKTESSVQTTTEGTEASQSESAGTESTAAPEKKRLTMWTYQVYSANDIEGIPALKEQAGVSFESTLMVNEKMEKMLRDLGAKVVYGGDKAYYHPGADIIRMPDKEKFGTVEDLYAVVGHELVHWTGHPDRMARKFGKVHGNPDYAKEELVACFGAFMLMQKIGIPMNEEHEKSHASYLKSWLECVKEDPKFLYFSASTASKAVDFLMEKSGLEVKAEVAPEKHGEVQDTSPEFEDEDAIPVL